MDPSVCKTCDIGKYAVAGSTECTVVRLAQPTPSRRKDPDSCEICPYSTYQPEEGMDECIRTEPHPPDPGAVDLEQCVGQVNFYTAIVFLW